MRASSAGRRALAFRRALGQTAIGRRVARLRRSAVRVPRAVPPDPAILRGGDEDDRLLAEALLWAERHRGRRQLPVRRRTARARRPFRNVLFISHTDFTGSSALHAYRIASELAKRNLSTALVLPDDPSTVDGVVIPAIPILTFDDVAADRLPFADGRIDLVHSFTPRERVRRLTARLIDEHHVPYVLHIEDDDASITAAQTGVPVRELERLPTPILDRVIRPGQMHPIRGRRFIECAAGYTLITDRLRDLVPSGVPTAIVRPGFDESMLRADVEREKVRAKLDVGADAYVIAYTGTVHASNAHDVSELYAAVLQLRARGIPAVLVKTGWNDPEAPELPRLGDAIRPLGWVPRATLASLLAAADVLVQPGAAAGFDEYRFPSKLPDYLATGVPVVAPRANIGMQLADEDAAVILDTGSADELARVLSSLRNDPARASAIGARGRAFAVRELRWRDSADAVETLYAAVAAGSGIVSSQSLEPGPPVKVIAFVDEALTPGDLRNARRTGVFGVCVRPTLEALAREVRMPFCFHIEMQDDLREIDQRSLCDAVYVEVEGAPLVVASADVAADEVRRSLGADIHLAGVTADPEAALRIGFDSAVESPTHVADLTTPLPDVTWFRCIAFAGADSAETYERQFCKLVLQTVARTAAQEPFIFVDPGGAASAAARERWLSLTSEALRNGLRRWYKSQGLTVSQGTLSRTIASPF